MNSLARKLSALCLGLAAAGATQAAPVTWGVTAAFDSASFSGTVDFDDATIQGFFDGMNDPSDTHIYGATLTLSSVEVGWVNQVFSNVIFQPYFYADQGDGPHFDVAISANGFNLYLDNGHNALLRSQAGFDNGTWAFNRNVTTVPEPVSLALVGLGLAAAGVARRKRQ